VPLKRLQETGVDSPEICCPPSCSASRSIRCAGVNWFRKELPMLDLLMLALGLGFFILSIGYAYACERL
jgi:hypothetical protein